ncbi:hypothetical protein ATI61_102820 [Archangium gephyra]|uniref:DUF4350 domain-containing protein n=1 Tax=Archangium gephyra TaxID=48 RepID=A0AAC8QEP2_9BACT|nr:DUF4350 domain-containing protein [Archangium gephyra]AKJ05766.1 Hypothetical protein AA314_07392 [Archangium gephyra]REG36442.1 hypothetical protein ATI61_102820 [Archangium gephyra]
MRDRFPLLVVGGLLITAVLGTWLVRGAARGGFADTLSTWRAQPDGARGLFLLVQESGLPAVRRTADLEILQKGTGTPVLLAVEVEGASEEDPDQTALAADKEDGLEDENVPRHGFNRLHVRELNDKETEKLLAHVKGGSALVYVPWGSKENPLLDALGVKLTKADTSLPMRTLVPPLSSPYTLGVERVEARVQAYLTLPEKGAVPLLQDEPLHMTVAAVVPYGAGKVLVVGAPELAMNQALARADNAQFWLSALRALGPGPYEFDEHHHGFTNERSVVDFARRYGLHFAVAQLLLGLCLWAVALKRFGRPRAPPESTRVGATDALFAMGRLYREGRHHGFAASLITKGLTQELALHAGLPAHAPAPSVVEGLTARGREDLANGLRAVVRNAETVSGEGDLKQLASRAAVLRQRIHPSGPPSRALAASTPEES